MVFLIIATVVLAVFTLLYFAAPSFLYKKVINDQRKAAGITVKSVKIPGFNIVYAAGGTGDPIVMLHGFGGSKNDWLQFAKNFTSEYWVILPDLPGFGESTKLKAEEFGIRFQVEKMHEFAKALQLERFHLVGHSMGGNIAGNFSGTYPEMVKSLALIDAARVITPEKSEFDLLMDKGVNPYVMKDVKDFDTLMEFLCYKPPRIPSFMKRYLAKRMMSTYELYEKSFNEEWEKSIFPESKIREIKAPTLIVWGDSDRNLHVSSAYVFEKNIENSRVVIISECGHVPFIERPEETASAYREFLRTGTNRGGRNTQQTA
jgi:pimeloyl-ACP methyl ester carboxylesterase